MALSGVEAPEVTAIRSLPVGSHPFVSLHKGPRCHTAQTTAPKKARKKGEIKKIQIKYQEIVEENKYEVRLRKEKENWDKGTGGGMVRV